MCHVNIPQNDDFEDLDTQKIIIKRSHLFSDALAQFKGLDLTQPFSIGFANEPSSRCREDQNESFFAYLSKK